jgi:hypothetical protein
MVGTRIARAVHQGLMSAGSASLHEPTTAEPKS